MVLVKSVLPITLVSREDSGPNSICDAVIFVTIGVISLFILGIIFLNIKIWRRPYKKTAAPVSAV